MTEIEKTKIVSELSGKNITAEMLIRAIVHLSESDIMKEQRRQIMTSLYLKGGEKLVKRELPAIDAAILSVCSDVAVEIVKEIWPEETAWRIAEEMKTIGFDRCAAIMNECRKSLSA